MKLINKILLSLSILLVANLAVANNRYVNYEGQGEWYSNSGKPAVKVYLKGSYVYAKLNDRKLKLPPARLKRINGNLLNEYTKDYILMQDFNRDRYLDIGVLKSVSYGGSNRCYAIFEYLPSFYTYKARSRKTVCID